MGGARTAWELAGDSELASELTDGVYALGPLTTAELEPWTARNLGTDMPGTAVTVQPTDAEAILKATSGLLPVLELFREWLQSSGQDMPDPLTADHATDFLNKLRSGSPVAEKAASRFAHGIPADLRRRLRDLFAGASEYGLDRTTTFDLLEASEPLQAAGHEFTLRVIDAAHWLGLLSVTHDQIEIPLGGAVGRTHGGVEHLPPTGFEARVHGLSRSETGDVGDTRNDGRSRYNWEEADTVELWHRTGIHLLNPIRNVRS